jgi:hypothetical protein
MKSTNAYSTDPNYAFDLVAFGLIVTNAFWPIFVSGSQTFKNRRSGRKLSVASSDDPQLFAK